MSDRLEPPFVVRLGDELGSIHVAGELDASTCGTLRAVIDALIDNAAAVTIVADMHAVEFMDSSGLGLLLGAYNKAAAVDKQFGVRNPSLAVTRILDITGQFDRFVIRDDVTESVAS